MSKGKQSYIENLEPGLLIAYKEGDELKSGKILKVQELEVFVEQFGGLKRNVLKNQIVWVKTGSRWPKEIFKLLRGDNNEEDSGSC